MKTASAPTELVRREIKRVRTQTQKQSNNLGLSPMQGEHIPDPGAGVTSRDSSGGILLGILFLKKTECERFDACDRAVISI